MLLNGKSVEKGRVYDLQRDLNNCIVTEYVRQHKSLADIWSGSECTLRIIMLRLPHDDPYAKSEWHEITSYARFGTSYGKGASNLTQGGVGVAFDYETGKLKEIGLRYKEHCKGTSYILTNHPDSHIAFKDFQLPNWDLVKEKISGICDYFTSLSYLGFDVILTKDAFKICEINTHPAGDYEQIMCGPYLADKKALEFFNAKGLKNVNEALFYDAYLKSQE